ncbi:unnamed protein product [Paramecium sonneborni]|uniref:Uncharacterized protein n=1 Tax=Paramecium sonneborni TaxID=65129 RepID=A0A8S1RT50_9CILI|nr:unnamed protein product [Paramecium sonneborni]
MKKSFLITIAMRKTGIQINPKLWVVVIQMNKILNQYENIINILIFHWKELKFTLNKTTGGRFVPRLFFWICYQVETLGQFFRPDIFGMEKSYMITAWSKGHYTRDAEFIDQVMIVVGQKAEGCDC